MMSSQEQLSANRRNAQRSTGPRTIQGKARSRQNSWQHGLSVKLNANSPESAEVEQLAVQFAGPNRDPAQLHFARIAAEADMELRRVQDASKLLISMAGRQGSTGQSDKQAYSEALPALLRLVRYERRAISRRNRALRLLSAPTMSDC